MNGSTLSNQEMERIREGLIRQNEQLRGKVEYVGRLTESIEKLHETMDRLDEAVEQYGLLRRTVQS